MTTLNDWQNYPDALHVLSLGAGRQSSVMYLMADAGLILPRPDVAIFADTGNEPPWVYEQLEYCRRVGSVPIHVVTNGNIYEDSMAALGVGENPWGAGRWVGPPVFSEGGGPIKRKCTQHYKVKPKEDEIRRLLQETGKSHVIDWRGHTTDEIERAKPDGRKYYVVRWPLLEERMSDAACTAWAKNNGHPEFRWSACEICPFRLREWERACQLMAVPETAARVVQIDLAVRHGMSQFGLDRRHYFNANYLPMTNFVADDYRSNQMSLFDCDGGVCGL